jgi:hypothetical protein
MNRRTFRGGVRGGKVAALAAATLGKSGERPANAHADAQNATPSRAVARTRHATAAICPDCGLHCELRMCPADAPPFTPWPAVCLACGWTGVHHLWKG